MIRSSCVSLGRQAEVGGYPQAGCARTPPEEPFASAATAAAGKGAKALPLPGADRLPPPLPPRLAGDASCTLICTAADATVTGASPGTLREDPRESERVPTTPITVFSRGSAASCCCASSAPPRSSRLARRRFSAWYCTAPTTPLKPAATLPAAVGVTTAPAAATPVSSCSTLSCAAGVSSAGALATVATAPAINWSEFASGDAPTTLAAAPIRSKSCPRSAARAAMAASSSAPPAPAPPDEKPFITAAAPAARASAASGSPPLSACELFQGEEVLCCVVHFCVVPFIRHSE